MRSKFCLFGSIKFGQIVERSTADVIGWILSGMPFYDNSLVILGSLLQADVFGFAFGL